ncbi:MAG TPA: RNA ligase family protein [Acidimicrobiia bacterium]
MIEIPPYGKVLNLGHRDLHGILDDPVIVQEKYDGSQISWAWDKHGELWATSKGKLQHGGGAVPDKMFLPAIEHLRSLPAGLIEGPLIFRGETVSSARHNTIEYGRVPAGHIVLFDVEDPGHSEYWLMAVQELSDIFGVEPAATLLPRGPLTLEECDRLLDTESSLGGTLIEGFVIKNYHKTNQRSGRPFLVGKFVSDRFKEVHKRSWKARHPSQGDIIERLAAALNTEARWEKAVQHLAEDGVLEESPRDIGALIREVQTDTMAEEADWISGKLIEWASDRIRRSLARGLPEWYKRRLFEGESTAGDGEGSTVAQRLT